MEKENVKEDETPSQSETDELDNESEEGLSVNKNQDTEMKYEISHGMPTIIGNPESKIDGQNYGGIDARQERAIIKRFEGQMKEVSDVVEEMILRLETVEKKLSEITSISETTGMTQENHQDFKEKIKELSALYDLLSSDVSPFLDMGKPQSSPPEKEASTEKEPSKIEIYNMDALLDWIDFLVKKAGRNLSDILEYYRELGWIEDSLKENILSYSRGIKGDTTDNGDVVISENGEVDPADTDWRLTPEDHKTSLKFIRAIHDKNATYDKQDTMGGE